MRRVCCGRDPVPKTASERASELLVLSHYLRARYRDGTDLTLDSHGLLFLECFKINICLGFEIEGDSIRWSRSVTT